MMRGEREGQPTPESLRSVALYDIDGTSYNGLLITKAISHLQRAGLLREENVTNFWAALAGYRNKELSYEQMAQLMLQEWAKGLTGQQLTTVSTETTTFLQQEQDNFYQYVRPSIQKVSMTHDVFFVTAQPQFLGDIVAQTYGAKGTIGTIFSLTNGQFTGGVERSLATREGKREAIHDVIKGRERNSIAIGDSPGDIDMLAAVAYPIAIRQGNVNELHITADRKGWETTAPDDALETILDIYNTFEARK